MAFLRVLGSVSHCIADTRFSHFALKIAMCDRTDFSHDCNIFRMITPEGTSPMQYLLPHTRVVGYPIGLRPYRSGAFVWTRTIGLVQEESVCACWSTAVYDGDSSRSVDVESLTKR